MMRITNVQVWSRTCAAYGEEKICLLAGRWSKLGVWAQFFGLETKSQPKADDIQLELVAARSLSIWLHPIGALNLKD